MFIREIFSLTRSVTWLRRLATGISPRRLAFPPKLVHVRFLVDKVALVQVFLRTKGVTPVTVIPPVILTCLCYKKDKRAKLGNLSKGDAVSEIGKHWIENTFTFFLSQRRSELDCVPMRVRCVVHKLAVGWVFLRVFTLFPVSIIPPIIYTQLHLHVTLTGRTNARSLTTFIKAILFQKSGSICLQINSTLLLL
jgi:hypothetical protein